MRSSSRGALIAAMLVGAAGTSVADLGQTRGARRMPTNLFSSAGGSRNSATAARRKARNRVHVRALRRRKTQGTR